MLFMCAVYTFMPCVFAYRHVLDVSRLLARHDQVPTHTQTEREGPSQKDMHKSLDHSHADSDSRKERWVIQVGYTTHICTQLSVRSPVVAGAGVSGGGPIGKDHIRQTGRALLGCKHTHRYVHTRV